MEGQMSEDDEFHTSNENKDLFSSWSRDFNIFHARQETKRMWSAVCCTLGLIVCFLVSLAISSQGDDNSPRTVIWPKSNSEEPAIHLTADRGMHPGITKKQKANRAHRNTPQQQVSYVNLKPKIKNSETSQRFAEKPTLESGQTSHRLDPSKLALSFSPPALKVAHRGWFNTHNLRASLQRYQETGVRSQPHAAHGPAGLPAAATAAAAAAGTRPHGPTPPAGGGVKSGEEEAAEEAATTRRSGPESAPPPTAATAAATAAPAAAAAAAATSAIASAPAARMPSPRPPPPPPPRARWVRGRTGSAVPAVGRSAAVGPPAGVAAGAGKAGKGGKAVAGGAAFRERTFKDMHEKERLMESRDGNYAGLSPVEREAWEMYDEVRRARMARARARVALRVLRRDVVAARHVTVAAGQRPQAPPKPSDDGVTVLDHSTFVSALVYYRRGKWDLNAYQEDPNGVLAEVS